MGTLKNTFSSSRKKKRNHLKTKKDISPAFSNASSALDDYIGDNTGGGANDDANSNRNDRKTYRESNRLSNGQNPRNASKYLKNEEPRGSIKRIIHNTISLFKYKNLKGLICKEEKEKMSNANQFNVNIVVQDNARVQPSSTFPKNIEKKKMMEKMKQKNPPRSKKMVEKISKKEVNSSKREVIKPEEKKVDIGDVSNSSNVCDVGSGDSDKSNHKTRYKKVQNYEGSFTSSYKVEINKNKIGYIQKRFREAKKVKNNAKERDKYSYSCSKMEHSSCSTSEDNSRRSSSSSSANTRKLNFLNCKIKMFNIFVESVKPTRSFNIDIIHPLYNFLCKNENSYLSSNWHDRINYAFRNIWNLKDYMYDEKSEGEREKEFYNELELFHMSSRIGACGLVYSLFLNSNQGSNNSSKVPTSVSTGECRDALEDPADYFKRCFVKVTKKSHPHIYKIYKPKFDDDLVFLFDSIVFTVVLGSRRNKVSYNTARKIYSNDLKGKTVLCDCIFNLKADSTFSLPISSQTDFMGMRIISEPLMPLTEDYTPIDVIKDIYEKASISDYMSGEEDTIEERCECNENCHCDKRITRYDLAKGKNSKLKKEKVFYERLMLEIESYDRKLYEQLRVMSNWVNYNCCILPFGLSNYVDLKLFKGRNNVKLFKSHIDNLLVIRGTEEILPPLLFNQNKEIFITRLRYEFVKYYYDRPLCNTTLAICIKHDKSQYSQNSVHLLKEASRENLNNIDNYVIPKIVNIVTNFSDSYDITKAYHSHGINMRNLGHILNGRKMPEYLSEVVCREIVCRGLKEIYHENLHTFLVNFLEGSNCGDTLTCNISSRSGSASSMPSRILAHSGGRRNREFDKQGRSECRKMICFCRKCFTYWNYFPELVPHKLLIRLLNLTLDVHSVDSIKFWHTILLPKCNEKFDVNLNDYIKIKEIEIYGLLICLEYHFGVNFNERCKENYNVRLPLTLTDVSTFCSKNEQHLFPNVGHLKGIFSPSNGGNHLIEFTSKGKYKVKEPHRCKTSIMGDSKNREYNHLRGIKSYNEERLPVKKNNQLMHIELLGSCDQMEESTRREDKDVMEPKNVYSLLEEMEGKNFSYEQSEINGDGRKKTDISASTQCDGNKHGKWKERDFIFFYPKVDASFPMYATWSHRAIEKLYNDTLVQEKFKIKKMLEENIVDTIYPKHSDFIHINNICSVGSCSKIKSFVYEYKIPCHPYCILNEKMKCIHYVRAKKSLYLLLNINIDKDIFKLTKTFLCLAYLHFEHGYTGKCLKICYYMYNSIPQLGTLKRDILILILQCKVKEGNIEDALIIYKLIVLFSRFYDGKNNMSTFLCNILLAHYYYDKANSEKEKMKGVTENGGHSGEKNMKKGDVFIREGSKTNDEVDREEEGGQTKGRVINTVDYFELKKKNLLKALYYSEECYRTITTTLNDISLHYLYIFSLMVLGNILMSLNKFHRAIKYYTLSLNYSIRGKMPHFIILQNKCSLADSLKKNGNFDKAIEIAEECLASINSSTCFSQNLILYIIFCLAEMKQYIGCKDLIFPGIPLDNKVCNVHIKKKILLQDFTKYELNYLNEKKKKYRQDAIDLYTKLYYKLKSQKNYTLVFAKDIFGHFYTKEELTICPDRNTNSFEENMEKIYLVIREILKIKVISLNMNKQFMLASKLLAIVLSKNSSAFVADLTLKGKRGAGERGLECIDRVEYNDHGEDSYIDELLSDLHMNAGIGGVDTPLHLELSNFHLNQQKFFFHRSCYTKEYDYISIEKILFDDTYFSIEDICKYCYMKCDRYNNRQKKKYKEPNPIYFLNPSVWFDVLFFAVMKGTYNNVQLLVLIDLIKFFLTPMQKQLILFRVKSLNSIRDNEQYSTYMQYILNRENKKIMHLANIVDKEKKNTPIFCDKLSSEFSNFNKENMEQNIDFLSNIIVTNPRLLPFPRSSDTVK
ncbi:conserved Plasmodium protein, unknown function [Plasmodium ovale wallikeri]|uniref:Clu domain-containing protein n=2 Tax=Plasmodium ovale TaxID=36330 RepID=A0A1A8ZTW4_PLAOA|nr:conserved Plasmodium protein, unknown function [Plasmodium ovale wallikeri]SBT48023.1 conserved Plasmodium protein, unknown function [Plasmodium ovale wallikeri]SBT82300.1 conserved Plasmodium protein, unknown function [Plasmodium ovale]